MKAGKEVILGASGKVNFQKLFEEPECGICFPYKVDLLSPRDTAFATIWACCTNFPKRLRASATKTFWLESIYLNPSLLPSFQR